jgi:hypothetical protein
MFGVLLAYQLADCLAGFALVYLIEVSVGYRTAVRRPLSLARQLFRLEQFGTHQVHE